MVEHFCFKVGDPRQLRRFLRYRAEKNIKMQTKGC